jgi:hypothetical protein
MLQSSATKVQTFPISLEVEKKGEVDAVRNSNVLAVDFNVIDGDSEDFAAGTPIGGFQAGADLRRERLQALQARLQSMTLGVLGL